VISHQEKFFWRSYSQVFNGPIAAFVRLLAAVEKQKGGGADESAPAAPESASTVIEPKGSKS